MLILIHTIQITVFIADEVETKRAILHKMCMHLLVFNTIINIPA